MVGGRNQKLHGRLICNHPASLLKADTHQSWAELSFFDRSDLKGRWSYLREQHQQTRKHQCCWHGGTIVRPEAIEAVFLRRSCSCAYLMKFPGAKAYLLQWGVPGPGGALPTAWSSMPVASIKTPATVTGLTPGTTYVFQARAVTHDGYSNWGDPIARIAV